MSYIPEFVGALFKRRVYISNPMDAPEGADVQQGPRGGWYYEGGYDNPGYQSPPDEARTDGGLPDSYQTGEGAGRIQSAVDAILGLFAEEQRVEAPAPIPVVGRTPTRRDLMGRLGIRNEPRRPVTPATDASQKSDDRLAAVETVTDVVTTALEEMNDLSEKELSQLRFAVRAQALAALSQA